MKKIILILIIIPVILFVILSLHLGNIKKEEKISILNTDYIVHVPDSWGISNSDLSLKIETEDHYVFTIDVNEYGSVDYSQLMQRLITVDGYIEIPFQEEKFVYIGNVLGFELYRPKNFSITINNPETLTSTRLYVKKDQTISNLGIVKDQGIVVQFLYTFPRTLTYKEILNNTPKSIIELDKALSIIEINKKT